MDHLSETLVKCIVASSRGLAFGDVRAQLQSLEGATIPDRTLQRRLAALVKSGRIRREGSRRYARYFPPVGHQADPTDPTIPLSTDGRSVLDAVRRPLSARALVGYDESLLLEYVPGATWYLSAARRAHLHEVGRVVNSADPAGTFAAQVYERLLIDLAWSSSRLEGNTYSRLDTENLLQRGQSASGKDAREAQMILNHKKAIELLVDGAQHIAYQPIHHLQLARCTVREPVDGCTR